MLIQSIIALARTGASPKRADFEADSWMWQCLNSRLARVAVSYYVQYSGTYDRGLMGSVGHKDLGVEYFNVLRDMGGANYAVNPLFYWRTVIDDKWARYGSNISSSAWNEFPYDLVGGPLGAPHIVIDGGAPSNPGDRTFSHYEGSNFSWTSRVLGCWVGGTGISRDGAISPCNRYLALTRVDATNAALCTVQKLAYGTNRTTFDTTDIPPRSADANNYLTSTNNVGAVSWRFKNQSTDYGRVMQLAVVDPNVTDKLRVYDVSNAYTGALTENTAWRSVPPTVPSGNITDIAFSPDGTKLVVVHDAGQPYVYDTSSDPWTNSQPISNIPQGGSVSFFWDWDGYCMFFSTSATGDSNNFHIFKQTDWTTSLWTNNEAGWSTNNIRPGWWNYAIPIGFATIGRNASQGGQPSLKACVKDGSKFRFFGLSSDASTWGTSGAGTPDNYEIKYADYDFVFIRKLVNSSYSGAIFARGERSWGNGINAHSGLSRIDDVLTWTTSMVVDHDSSASMYYVYVSKTNSTNQSKYFACSLTRANFRYWVTLNNVDQDGVIYKGCASCAIRPGTNYAYFANAGTSNNASDYAITRYLMPNIATTSTYDARYLQGGADFEFLRFSYDGTKAYCGEYNGSNVELKLRDPDNNFAELTAWKSVHPPKPGDGNSIKRISFNATDTLMVVGYSGTSGTTRITIWDTSSDPWTSANITLPNISNFTADEGKIFFTLPLPNYPKGLLIIGTKPDSTSTIPFIMYEVGDTSSTWTQVGSSTSDYVYLGTNEAAVDYGAYSFYATRTWHGSAW